jgi:hypothetical protein
MDLYATKSQRRKSGARLVEFCPVSFAHNGQNYCVLMQDLSNDGAQLLSFNYDQYPELNPGDELAMTVRTPYGESSVTGNVRWVGEKNGHFSWGMQFTNMAGNAKDPIRCLMDSPW